MKRRFSDNNGSILAATIILVVVGTLILHIGKLIVVADSFGKSFGF